MDEESNSIEETQLETEQTDQTKVATLEAQKVHWREKAQKLALEVEALRAQVPKVETKKEEPEELTGIKETVSQLKLAETKRQFGYEHGLSPEETDAVFKLNPAPTKETLEDPFVKGGLEAIRAKKKLADNTPGVTHATPHFVSDKNLTPAEKEAEFQRFLRSKAGK